MARWALAAAAAAAPCARAANADLIVGVPTNLTGLDPADANDTLSQSACRLMMQGLYGFDKDMKLIPVLAESYTRPRGRDRVHLQAAKGIRFHDGTPFDADAVKANFDRVTNPANNLKRTSLYAMIDRTEVVDRLHREVRAEEPVRRLRPTIAHPSGMMISPAALQQYGSDINRNPVGTGPFKFVSWKRRHAEGDEERQVLEAEPAEA